MKGVLWIVGLFAVAVGLSLFAQINTGYALLIVPPYRVELSLNAAVLVLLGAIILAHVLLRVVSLAVALPGSVQRYQRRRKLKAARDALREATVAYFEGRYQKAEQLADKSIADEYAPENQAVALLLAARSAHATKDYARRDGYLERMEALPKNLQLARNMVAAELYFEEKNVEGALSAVEAARGFSPNLTAALRLELKVRQLGKAPEHVLQLTDKLLKSEAINSEQAQRYRRAAYLQQLNTLVDRTELRQWWARIPSLDRHHPDLLFNVARQYAELGDTHAAALLLADSIEHNWSSDLAGALGHYVDALSGEERLALVRRAELWLEHHRRDHQLLLTLGRLTLAQQLWGKAQSYFEASLSVLATLEAHAELARLFERLEKPEAASHHYEESVRLALAQSVRPV